MSIARRLRCWLTGKCERPAAASPALEQMQQTLNEAVAVKHEARALKETGIWLQDMLEGQYQPPRRPHKPRKVRHVDS